MELDNVEYPVRQGADPARRKTNRRKNRKTQDEDERIRDRHTVRAAVKNFCACKLNANSSFVTAVAYDSCVGC